MEMIKKHIDTVVILSSIIGSMLWMNGKFNEIDKKFNDVQVQFKEIEREIAIIKTILVMKNIMPAELAKAPSPAPLLN
jgi:hypothetical protein